MARPQVADGGDAFQLWRAAANILNNQSRTADKGWSSSLEVRCRANNSSREGHGGGIRPRLRTSVRWRYSVGRLIYPPRGPHEIHRFRKVPLLLYASRCLATAVVSLFRGRCSATG
jgi:hypothetical protein